MTSYRDTDVKNAVKFSMGGCGRGEPATESCNI